MISSRYVNRYKNYDLLKKVAFQRVHVNFFMFHFARFRYKKLSFYYFVVYTHTRKKNTKYKTSEIEELSKRVNYNSL